MWITWGTSTKHTKGSWSRDLVRITIFKGDLWKGSQKRDRIIFLQFFMRIMMNHFCKDPYLPTNWILKKTQLIGSLLGGWAPTWSGGYSLDYTSARHLWTRPAPHPYKTKTTTMGKLTTYKSLDDLPVVVNVIYNPSKPYKSPHLDTKVSH